MPVRALLNRVDATRERTLLWINLVLACFVILAHGGGLAFTYVKAIPDVDQIRQLATISLPIAALVLITAVAALVRTSLGRIVLSIHGIALAASAVALLIWGVLILLRGLPQGNFAWSVGMMSAWVVYSIFLLSRYSIPVTSRSWPPVFYSPLIALVIAVPIDVGVFVRAMSEISRRFG